MHRAIRCPRLVRLEAERSITCTCEAFLVALARQLVGG